MDKINIGMGGLLFENNTFDTIKSLEKCQEIGLKTFQIYMDDFIVKDNDNRNRVRTYAKDNSIHLIAHSPVSLNETVLSDNLFKSTLDLLLFEDEKKLVIHMDENLSIEQMISITKDLNKLGITVCLENFYSKYDKECLLNNVEKYNSFFEEAHNKSLQVYPVLDLPRLFISSFRKSCESYDMAKNMVENAIQYANKIILHCIDFNDFSQKRESWCPLGKGLMPYDDLFSIIKNSIVEIDTCVLEYETEGLILESLGFLESL